jgi:hypothetical protein
VNVVLPDTDEEPGSQLVTFPAKELEAAAQVAGERSPGSWLSSYRYEQALRRVLEHLVSSEAGLNILSQARGESATTDSRADFVLDNGVRRFIIEAKAPVSGQVARQAVDQLLRYLSITHASAGLLVTNVPLSGDALNKLEEAHQEGHDIRTIQWHPSEDDAELERAVRELLLAA